MLQNSFFLQDSVFAEIPASMCDTNCSQEELIAKVDKIGDEMGKFCTQAFLPPNDLEYEKFYYPLLLKGKKRYAGHKFEPGLAPKLDVKGFVSPPSPFVFSFFWQSVDLCIHVQHVALNV